MAKTQKPLPATLPVNPPPKNGRGQRPIAERIKKLETLVGRKGQETVTSLLEEYDANIIKLAYLRLPRTTGSMGIGKRNEQLAAALSEDEAQTLIALLQKAKSAKG